MHFAESRDPAPSAGAESGAGSLDPRRPLRMATWNIAGARRSWSSEAFDYTTVDLPAFAEQLARIDADVVCLQLSGLHDGQARPVSDHVVHVRTSSGAEPGALIVFTTSHSPRRALLELIAGKEDFAGVLAPESDYRIMRAQIEVDQVGLRPHPDGISLSRVEDVEPSYREPDNAQIRAALVDAYLGYRSAGLLPDSGFDAWLLGRITADTSLADLAARYSNAGPVAADPFTAWETARRLVEKEVGGRDLSYYSDSVPLYGRTVRVEISGLPIDVPVSGDQVEGYRVKRSLAGMAPGMAVAKWLDGLHAASEQELERAVQATLRDPTVNIAVAEPNMESEAAWQRRFEREMAQVPGWRTWTTWQGPNAWSEAVATQLHLPEARRAAAVLAARDVLVAEGAVPIGEGMGIAWGGRPRVVVAVPVPDLPKLVQRTIEVSPVELDARGVDIVYRSVSVDDQGRVEIQDRPFAGDDSGDAVWDYYHEGFNNSLVKLSPQAWEAAVVQRMAAGEPPGNVPGVDGHDEAVPPESA
ncbi:endonuclease/exonuclease/phosphatase family protein [Nocardia sp. KC 131]|uniref:endonuclease/exonuclease/phosphatase family protein n=1 Tax=Nocardia arseniciresistens TaxID=3392119 RepID=UPI00398E5EEF